MDWALEELLQEPGPMINEPGTDYIDHLHEMLNAQQQSDSYAAENLPDPLPENASDDLLLPVLSPPEGYRDDQESMTSPATSPQQLHDQVTLPGQQGPQATFPYHYQQLLKDDLDRGIEQPKKQNSTSSTPILSSMLAARPDRPHLQGALEHDSGIESIDSLSPKDLDNTPLHSPEVAKVQAEPILTSLLSAPPSKEPPFSASMLSTLLTCHTRPAQRVNNEVAKINVVSINPHNMSLVNEGSAQEVKVEASMDVTVHVGSDHELSLAEFLDGCAKVASETTTSVIRSTLEDLEVMQENQKTNNTIKVIQELPDLPHKQDDFDYVMCQKVVPEWDTDLNFRLQQLDNVLATASKSNPSTSDEEEPHVDKPKRYSCPSCSATFNSCGARNSHRRKVHERFHVCRECDMAFGSAQKLERHMKTHSGIKEFKCETCGKEFMIERNLTLHYKVHLGQKDFICSICDRTYYTKSGLQAHTRQLHAPPPKNHSGFFCKQCLQKCPTRYDLTLHRKQVHAGDVLGEKCSQCPMSFRTLTELKRHVIAAHSNRPFACPHCPHRSKTKDKLDRHLLCHAGPRESFQCQLCEKKFVFKNSLKKHLEKGRCDFLKKQKKLNDQSELNTAQDLLAITELLR